MRFSVIVLGILEGDNFVERLCEFRDSIEGVRAALLDGKRAATHWMAEQDFGENG